MQSTQQPEFYYMAKVGDFAKTLKRHGISGNSGSPHWGNWGGPHFFNKEDIDRLPKYLRRGGEYGHDAVRIYRPMNMRDKQLCKMHNLEIIRKGTLRPSCD